MKEQIKMEDIKEFERAKNMFAILLATLILPILLAKFFDFPPPTFEYSSKK